MTLLTATIRCCHRPEARPSRPATTTTPAVAAQARMSSRTARSLPEDGERPVVATHRPGHHRPDRQGTALHATDPASRAVPVATDQKVGVRVPPHAPQFPQVNGVPRPRTHGARLPRQWRTRGRGYAIAYAGQ